MVWPNVNYLKVFGSKCYILKVSRKGKFDVKGDEGSCKRKAYKCSSKSQAFVI